MTKNDNVIFLIGLDKFKLEEDPHSLKLITYI